MTAQENQHLQANKILNQICMTRHNLLFKPWNWNILCSNSFRDYVVIIYDLGKNQDSYMHKINLVTYCINKMPWSHDLTHKLVNNEYSVKIKYKRS